MQTFSWLPLRRRAAAAELEAEKQLAALRADYNRAFSACLEGKGHTVR